MSEESLTVAGQTLFPLQGQVGPDFIEMSRVERPFIPISERDHAILCELGSANYYLTEEGRVVTFGPDGKSGFALKPLTLEAARDILAENV